MHYEIIAKTTNPLFIESSESYLNFIQDKDINKTVSVQIIHPGYLFEDRNRDQNLKNKLIILVNQVHPYCTEFFLNHDENTNGEEGDENLETDPGLELILKQLQRLTKVIKLNISLIYVYDVATSIIPQLYGAVIHMSNLRDFSLITNNILIGNEMMPEPTIEEGVHISDKISENDAYLILILSFCQNLERFCFHGNMLSAYLQDKLNETLKNMPHIREIELRYLATGGDFTPIADILKNPSVESFHYTLTNIDWDVYPSMDTRIEIEDFEYVRPYNPPQMQLESAILSLQKNNTLKHLYIDFSEAFEDSNMHQLFCGHDPVAFFNIHLSKFYYTISLMPHLKSLCLNLPIKLSNHMDSYTLQNRLIRGFQPLMDNPAFQILANDENISSALTKQQEHYSPIFGLFNQNDYQKSLVHHKEFFALNKSQIIEHDIALYHYISKSLRDENDDKYATLINHFSDAIGTYFPRSLPIRSLLIYLTPNEIIKFLSVCGGLIKHTCMELALEKYKEQTEVTCSTSAAFK